ncbi:hypothetical protein HS125_19695 [bacterium]|nr:hypothetical protein [bacterium]
MQLGLPLQRGKEQPLLRGQFDHPRVKLGRLGGQLALGRPVRGQHQQFGGLLRPPQPHQPVGLRHLGADAPARLFLRAPEMRGQLARVRLGQLGEQPRPHPQRLLVATMLLQKRQQLLQPSHRVGGSVGLVGQLDQGLVAGFPFGPQLDAAAEPARGGLIGGAAGSPRQRLRRPPPQLHHQRPRRLPFAL